jgi:hypothetical protein
LFQPSYLSLSRHLIEFPTLSSKTNQDKKFTICAFSFKALSR